MITSVEIAVKERYRCCARVYISPQHDQDAMLVAWNGHSESINLYFKFVIFKMSIRNRMKNSWKYMFLLVTYVNTHQSQNAWKNNLFPFKTAFERLPWGPVVINTCSVIPNRGRKTRVTYRAKNLQYGTTKTMLL